MPVVRISEDTMERLKKWAEPLVDTTETAFVKVLNAAEQTLHSQHGMAAKAARGNSNTRASNDKNAKVKGSRCLSARQIKVLEAVRQHQPCSKLEAAKVISEPPSYSYGYSCLDTLERYGLVSYEIIFESSHNTETGNGSSDYSYRYKKYHVRLTATGRKALETGLYKVAHPTDKKSETIGRPRRGKVQDKLPEEGISPAAIGGPVRDGP